jgi:hypothetical protein
MLITQAAATVVFAAKGSEPAARALGVLGAAMVGGYLVEQEFRTALSPEGWDRTLTPVAVAGFTFAGPMAHLGLSCREAH